MSHVHSIVCRFFGFSFRQSLLTWFSKFNCSKIYNHRQKSWDRYTVRMLFNTSYINLRALTNPVRPHPPPQPHVQCWNRLRKFFLIFQYCTGWGRGRGYGFLKWSIALFFKTLLVIRKELLLCSYCPKDFCPGLSVPCWLRLHLGTHYT